VGAIWAGAMMLEHLGPPEAAAAALGAVERVLASGVLTTDMGGKATTSELGKAIASEL
jgi:tartrate dehydrogenase/decarboxylase / D-malate dehydrogenase